jgi:hypothetical protein
MFLATVLAKVAVAPERLGMAGAKGAQNFPDMGRQAMSFLQGG